jgi:hypothetical protein
MQCVKKEAKHWGTWVMLRSEAVGWKRQSDLADSVGCTRERIARWFGMASPPVRMRKGFDIALANSLEVSHETLFLNWSKTSPDEAERIWELPSSGERPWERADWQAMSIENKLRILVFYIADEEATQKLVEFGIIVAQAQDSKNARAIRASLRQANRKEMNRQKNAGAAK